MTEIVRNSKNRCIRFELRLTVDERRKLESHAKVRGTTSASLLRYAFLGHPLPERKTEIEAEAIVALNRIGSNINQIARAGNKSGTLTGDQKRALAVHLKRLDELAIKIREKVE